MGSKETEPVEEDLINCLELQGRKVEEFIFD